MCTSSGCHETLAVRCSADKCALCLGFQFLHRVSAHGKYLIGAAGSRWYFECGAGNGRGLFIVDPPHNSRFMVKLTQRNWILPVPDHPVPNLPSVTCYSEKVFKDWKIIAFDESVIWRIHFIRIESIFRKFFELMALFNWKLINGGIHSMMNFVGFMISLQIKVSYLGLFNGLSWGVENLEGWIVKEKGSRSHVPGAQDGRA